MCSFQITVHTVRNTSLGRGAQTIQARPLFVKRRPSQSQCRSFNVSLRRESRMLLSTIPKLIVRKMIVQKRAPWEAFQPVAELEFMPFRDAGRGHSDFNLSIQDCLWGMWKAMQNGLCDMNEFSVEDYEYYEKVENGDWNWLTPSFIAFASPVEPQWVKGETASLQRKLPTPFQNCLDYFEARGVKLVVRLNNMLYNKRHFEERGIRHEELYFDDGTNPTDEIVRKFINLADEVVEAGGAIAVHVRSTFI